MEATLVVVTLLSLALAIGMAIVTWHVLQEARQRADARVALLEEGLTASLAADSLQFRAAASHASAVGVATEDAAKEWPEDEGRPRRAWPSALVGLAGERDTSAAASGSAAFRASAAEDAAKDGGEELSWRARPTALVAERDDMMSAATGHSPRRLAVATGVGLVLAILAMWSVGRLMAPGIGGDGRSAAARGPAVANAAPLELVSLEQTRDGDALTVHGVVRNPQAGVMIDRLAVVVAFFDGSGQQLASVRAPLDFRSLAPGDESPFQVTTSVPAGVTRYRVSFRRDEGTIVPHVDRRQQEAS